MTSHRVTGVPTRTELQQFKVELLGRREELLTDVRSLEKEEMQAGGTASGLSIHSAELGTDRAAQDVSLGCLESAVDEVQEIDEALRRIEEGAFGMCDACGSAINLKRLKAIPYANLCLSCKKAEETF